jgi:hypothetical protein
MPNAWKHPIMVLYENHLFFDTRPSITEAIGFAGLGFGKIGRDFRTPTEFWKATAGDP